jgi:hypothetical protein
MFFVIFGFFHVSTSYKNKLVSHTFKTFEIYFLEDLLHVTDYTISLLFFSEKLYIST